MPLDITGPVVSVSDRQVTPINAYKKLCNRALECEDRLSLLLLMKPHLMGPFSFHREHPTSLFRGMAVLFATAVFQLLFGLAFLAISASGTDCTDPNTACSLGLGVMRVGAAPDSPLAYNGRQFYEATIDVAAIESGFSGYDLVGDPGELGETPSGTP